MSYLLSSSTVDHEFELYEIGSFPFLLQFGATTVYICGKIDLETMLRAM